VPDRRPAVAAAQRDIQADAVRGLAGRGATGPDSLADLVAKLAKPRAVWIMVRTGEITQAVGRSVAAL
jgi:6-phosphogluconate dehydrogenase